MGISKTLGILSIIGGLISPIVGLICGIVGVSVKKEEGHYDRDVTLNVIGIVVSILSWIVTTILLWKGVIANPFF